MNWSLTAIYAVGCFGTVAAAVGGAWLASTRGLCVGRVTAWVVLLGSPYLLVLQILKLRSHHDYVDFAVWMEIVNNIAAGRGAWSSIQESFVPGTGGWFSTHFTPLLYLIALPFKIVPAAETVLVLQYCALMGTAVAVYLYARKIFEDRNAALVAAAIAVLCPTFQYINLYAFEMLRFCIPILVLLFLTLEHPRPSPSYWVLLGLALLIREEVSITTAMIGVLVAVTHQGWRRAGVLTMAISVAYFLTITQWLMPALRTTGQSQHVAAYWFADLGTTPIGIVWGILTKPLVVVRLAADPLKLASAVMLLLPFCFLPLLSWSLLLPAAGNFGLNLLSGSPAHTSYFLYYVSPTLALLLVAFVRSVPLAEDKLRRWTRAPRRVVLTGAFCGALAANLFFGPSPASLTFWVEGWRLAPFRTQNFHRNEYSVSQRDRQLTELLEAVPRAAIVAAEQHLLPGLFDRRALRVFPDVGPAEYVVFDKLRREKTGVGTVPGSWNGFRERPQEYYDLVERDSKWRLVLESDGFYIYRRQGGA